MAIALLVITALVFGRTLGNGFVNYDDPAYVTANDHVREGLHRETIAWAFQAEVASNWHPLTCLSHLLDVSLFGQNPAGHHATSVLLHAAATAFAFVALYRLTDAFWRSALCAVLFAWHPLRVESVAWVAERKDVLSGCFFFLGLWCYARYVFARGSQRWGWYAGALGSCAAGLMAKPMLVTFPFVLLLVDFWPLRRWVRTQSNETSNAPLGLGRLLIEKLPFLGLAVLSCVITYRVQSHSGAVTAALTGSERMANAVVAVARYLGKIVWPVDLAVLYPHPGRWPTAAVVAAAILTAGVTFLCGAQYRRRPWLIFGWLWFLGMLVPVIGLVQVGLQSMADRYTYLPSVGLMMALVWTGADLFGRSGDGVERNTKTRSRSTGASRYLPALLVVPLVILTVVQLGVWRSSLTLFTKTIAVAGEGNYLAYDNRGIALQEAGQAEAAIADYERALAIKPDYPNANNNLGRTLADRGKPREAIAHYRVALRAKPDLLELHNNLANALSDVGALDEAIEHYQIALAREPKHLNARNGYAVALAMKGAMADAEREFRAVLALEPTNVGALSNLGNVCAMQGRRDEAAALYQRVLAVQPDDAKTLYNLGNLQLELGHFDQAVENYRRAVKLAPMNPDAHAMLGFAFARQGRRAEAIQELSRALQQRPDHLQARAWLEAVQKQ